MHNSQRIASGLSRRDFLRLGAGAGAAALLAACGGEGGPGAPQGAGDQAATEGAAALSSEYTGPDVQLAFWNGFTGGDGPLLRQLVQEFNGAHDNIAVEMNVMQWADYYERVPSAVSSGRGPDVGIMHLDALATNAARGVIQPLDAMTEVLGYSAENFPERVWEAGIWNDARYGIPLDIHPLGFYYNKTLMEQAGLDPESPPQTREEYMDALEALKAEGIQGHWISSFPFTGLLVFQSLLWQNGGQLYNEEGTEAVWNSPEGVEALEWMTSLIEMGYSPPDVAQDAEHVAFQNGDNAFIWNGIWMINAYNDTPDLEWGVAPVPTIFDENAVWASSHNFVVMNKRGMDDNVIQAATVFIDWISEHSLEWAKAGQIPARASVRESEEFAELEAQSTFAQQLDYVHFIPTIPGVGDAQSELETGYNVAALGREEPEAALDQSAQQATQLLQQAAEQYGG